MVVMLIVALLMAMISAGAAKALRAVDNTRATSEIQQLAAALDTLKSRHNLDRHPPSRLFLGKFLADYNELTSDLPQIVRLKRDSRAYLCAMFRGIEAPTGAWNTTGIDWTGGTDATWATGTPAPVILEGDQCLVFFLGGPPTASGGCAGFSTDPNNPAMLTGPRHPTHPFDATRLVKITHNIVMGTYTGTNLFPSYKDYYGGPPYAYFSSYGTNMYNRYGDSGNRTGGLVNQISDSSKSWIASQWVGHKVRILAGHQAGTELAITGNSANLLTVPGITIGTPQPTYEIVSSDCPTLQVAPYLKTLSPPTYYNDSTCQIISAGRNGVFGPGGFMRTGSGPTYTVLPWTRTNVGIAGVGFPSFAVGGGPDDRSNYKDDITNFSGGMLAP